MNTLLIYWVLLPAWVKVALWVSLGIVLTAVMRRMLPPGRARKYVPIAFLSVYLPYPYAQAWIKGAVEDYRVQKDAWLAARCRETMAGEAIKVTKAVPVEGFLVSADYDKLVNERFQRAGAIMESKREGGGSFAIDTGGIRAHPIHDVIPGRTFAVKAYLLLTQRKFSYVEFALVPDSKGEYSNAGLLNTKGWSGVRYRLYYLAPSNDPNCVSESEEGLASAQAVIGGQAESSRAAPDKPFCLAFDITDKAMSKYQLIGDEPRDMTKWEVNLRGVKVPAWIDIRWDRIQVTSDAGEHYRYLGFDYPDEVSPKYRCHDAKLAARILGTVLVPDASRAFYRKKAWYVGSAVQRLYEPEMAAEVPEPKPATSAQAGEQQCPDAQRKGGGPAAIDQLDDFSRRDRWRMATQSGVSGTQPASYFMLSQGSSISLLAWSGMVSSNPDGEKFLVRIFKDMDGVPGELAYESEVKAGARSGGTWAPHKSHIFEARMSNLHLPAGGYWLSVLSPLNSQSGFFWNKEPAGDRPICGSGGITRFYDGGKWGGPGGGVSTRLFGVAKPRELISATSPDPSQQVAHRNARGYSFRLEAKSKTGQK